MNDNYSTPSAELENLEGRTIEAGISGDYDFSIGQNLSEAWSSTKGVKRYILGAGIIMYIAMTVVMIAIVAITAGIGAIGQSGLASIIASLAIQIAVWAVVMPFVGGILLMGLKHCQNQEVAFSDLFSCFNKTMPLIIATILMNILVIIGFLLFILPGVYLMIAYLLTIPLIIDRDMGPWEALEASRKAISKRWFSVFFWYLALMIIVIISMLPLGIGLIWTIPMMVMAIVLLYRDVFGIASE